MTATGSPSKGGTLAARNAAAMHAPVLVPWNGPPTSCAEVTRPEVENVTDTRAPPDESSGCLQPAAVAAAAARAALAAPRSNDPPPPPVAGPTGGGVVAGAAKVSRAPGAATGDDRVVPGGAPCERAALVALVLAVAVGEATGCAEVVSVCVGVAIGLGSPVAERPLRVASVMEGVDEGRAPPS